MTKISAKARHALPAIEFAFPAQRKEPLQNASFVRAHGGTAHVFAHNGYLTGIDSSHLFGLGSDQPIGETDSERAFCSLLKRMRGLWCSTGVPALQARMSLLTDFAADLRTLDTANFLYADSVVSQCSSDESELI